MCNLDFDMCLIYFHFLLQRHFVFGGWGGLKDEGKFNHIKQHYGAHFPTALERNQLLHRFYISLRLLQYIGHLWINAKMDEL